jgi:hypothetical protein
VKCFEVVVVLVDVVALVDVVVVSGSVVVSVVAVVNRTFVSTPIGAGLGV